MCQENLKGKARGFTLIELLVVIAIIALLLSVILPSLNAAKRQARAVICATRMRQITQANLAYAASYKKTSNPWRFAFGCRARMLQGSLVVNYLWVDFKTLYNYDTMPGDPRYKAFTTGELWPHLESGEVFVCPSIPKDAIPNQNTAPFGYDPLYGYTPRWSYVANGNPPMVQQGVKDYNLTINPDAVKPNPSSVCMYMDQTWNNNTSLDNTVVLFGRNFQNNQNDIYNYDMLSDYHQDGGNLSYFDGHVKRMKQKDFIEKYAYTAAATRSAAASGESKAGPMDLFGGLQ